MPNTTTLNETTRSPIDGTEDVRLATAGANWKASLAAIFAAMGSGGAAAGSDTDIQYNNTGTFAATGALVWDYTNKIIKFVNTNTVQIDAGNNKVTSNGTELVLEETGDSLGTVRLHMQNRTGVAGALFENVGVDVVDFVLKTSTAATGNYRFEHRAASLADSSNSTGEIQHLVAGSRNFWVGAASAGFDSTGNAIPTGIFYLGPSSSGMAFQFNSSTAKMTLTPLSCVADLIDFELFTTGGGSAWLRFEHRGGVVSDPSDSAGELQFWTNGALQGYVGQHGFGFTPSGTLVVDWGKTNANQLTINQTNLMSYSASLTNGAGTGSGVTFTNAPGTSGATGNPTKWVPINDNGTTRYIPAF